MRAATLASVISLATVSAAVPTPWDLDWAKTAPLDIRISAKARETVGGVPILTRELTYFCHDSKGDPIRIFAHLAMPPSAADTPLPAMVLMHTPWQTAAQYAARENIVALVPSRVGEEGSEGPHDHYSNWMALDEGEDVRNGWMYHFVMSAIRGVTLLAEMPEVRPDKIGVAGASRGGMCTLLTSAADDRIALCVPLQGTGDFGRTAEFERNWVLQHMVEGAGKTKDSLAFRRFLDNYDPASYVDDFHGTVWIVDGAQDEYFPITSAIAMLGSDPSSRRIEIVPDADHGYFGKHTGEYDSYYNDSGWPTITACLSKAIRAVLHGDGVLPTTPKAHFERDADTLTCHAHPDTSDPIEAVNLIYSTDGAYTFKRIMMQEGPNKDWHASTEIGQPDSLAAYVEVTYHDTTAEYRMSSIPMLSEGFKPNIRPAPKN